MSYARWRITRRAWLCTMSVSYVMFPTSDPSVIIKGCSRSFSLLQTSDDPISLLRFGVVVLNIEIGRTVGVGCASWPASACVPFAGEHRKTSHCQVSIPPVLIMPDAWWVSAEALGTNMTSNNIRGLGSGPPMKPLFHIYIYIYIYLFYI